MQKTPLSLKDYIKNPKSLQDFECGICFELSADLAKCRGPCQKVFCTDCVSQAKTIIDRCPNRCSQPFFVVKLPPIPINFMCPFSQACELSIPSVQAFRSHYLQCSFTPPAEWAKYRLKKEYLCPLEHNLQFFVGNYQEMVSSMCAECGEQKLCRSICRKCDEKYCIACRMPPCSRKRCPIGHDFTYFHDHSMQYICDVCGLHASIFNTGIYDDKVCNFGICESCIKDLPEESNSHHLYKLANDQDCCECGSELAYRPHAEEETGKKKCSMCERSKSCPKYCPSCGLDFCLKCKTLTIYKNTCAFDHEFLAVPDHPSGCMRCDKTAPLYLRDAACGVTLCPECKDYYHAITNDKLRLRPVFCEEGHKLCFLEQYEAVCVKCKEEKEVRLICLECKGQEAFYCLQCKLVSLEACYFDHPLATNSQQHPPTRSCSICLQDHPEHKSCRKCKFYACQACHQLTTPPSLGQLSIH